MGRRWRWANQLWTTLRGIEWGELGRFGAVVVVLVVQAVVFVVFPLGGGWSTGLLAGRDTQLHHQHAATRGRWRYTCALLARDWLRAAGGGGPGELHLF